MVAATPSPTPIMSTLSDPDEWTNVSTQDAQTLKNATESTTSYARSSYSLVIVLQIYPGMLRLLSVEFWGTNLLWHHANDLKQKSSKTTKTAPTAKKRKAVKVAKVPYGAQRSDGLTLDKEILKLVSQRKHQPGHRPPSGYQRANG